MFTFTPGITMTAGMTFTPVLPPPTALDYLLVAGGGGGGRYYGGAGGAGGLLTSTGYSVVSNATYTVTVGTGGPGAPSTGIGTAGTNSIVSSNNSYTFNGSTNSLNTPSSSVFNLSTGAWTIEGWFYLTAFTGDDRLFTVVSSASSQYGIYLRSGTIFIGVFGVSEVSIGSISLNTWTHLAFVKGSGGATITSYKNGVSVGSTAAYTFPNTNCTFYIGASPANYSQLTTNGNISNVRVVNGVAVYTGTFTVPTNPLTATQSAGTNISAITGTQTALLTLQNATIIDNSTNAFTITNTGGVAFSSSTPFTINSVGGGYGGGNSSASAGGPGGSGGGAGGPSSASGGTGTAGQGNNGGTNTSGGGAGGGGAGAAGGTSSTSSAGTGGVGLASTIIPNYSISFNGSSQYLTSSANLTNNFSTGNFTIECWVYFVSVANGQLVSAGSGTNTNAYYWQYYSGQLQFGVQNVGQITGTSWTPSASTWYHIAVVRSGTNVYQFVNGTQLGTTATSSQNFVDGPTYVGYGGAGYLNGYLSNLRIVKGTALYISNFPVPTPPLRAITNTSLLTAQSSTIVDNSTNASTITAIGSPVVSSTVIPTAYYAGGGGGSAGFGVLTNGGAGGGGYGATDTAGSFASAGAANTGGGGGGGSNPNSDPTWAGKNGGSGITIIRYQSIYAQATTTGSPTFTSTGGYNIYTWTSSGSFFFAPFVPSTVEYLVVAGGGGGGSNGGGGGAGGLLTASGFSVTAGTSYTVTVGAGGAAPGTGSGTYKSGANGLNSVFSTITSTGGGGGGGADGANGNGSGSAGGSGGGGGWGLSNTVGGAGNTPSTTPIQGYAGGTGLSGSNSGGAGGGAGAVGGNASGTVGGTGGIGVQSSITGTATYYAGGGAGGGYSGSPQGGSGGGGYGGVGLNVVGGPGTANTGGGGGGGAGNNAFGGAGGSGVVIVRYESIYAAAASTTGSPTITTSGGYRIYTWTSSGSITF